MMLIWRDILALTSMRSTAVTGGVVFVGASQLPSCRSVPSLLVLPFPTPHCRAPLPISCRLQFVYVNLHMNACICLSNLISPRNIKLVCSHEKCSDMRVTPQSRE